MTRGLPLVVSRNTMRTCLPILLLILLNTNLHAQSGASDAPAAARQHLATQHPDAVVKEWERRKRNFKVEFKVKGVEYDSYYTVDGVWVRTEHDIEKKDLPAAITTAMKAGKYGTWKTEDVEQHATPKHAILYKVKVQSGGEVMEVFYLPDGTLVKEQKDHE